MTEKLKILEEVLGQYRISKQEHLFLCPYCDHYKKKFSVNIEKNVYKCWVCDTRGNDVYHVIRRHGSFRNIQQWRSLTNKVELNAFENIFAEPEEIKESKLPLPKEFVSLVDNYSFSSRNARSYLRERGVSKADILRWKIGYCPTGDYESRIIIPSFGMSGRANFFIARSYNGDWMRYKNPESNRNIIFNELYVDWGRDIILVEGVFDAMRAYDIGSPIPLLGSTLRIESKLFQSLVRNATRVFLALDDNTVSDLRKASAIAESLMAYGIETCPISTYGYHDVAEMPRGILLERKMQAGVADRDEFLYRRIRSL